MPVLVTGPESAAGSVVVRTLLASGGEVRVFIDPALAPADAVERLRGWGAKTAVGEADDEGRLELALEQVHTVVHLDGGLLREPADELDAAAVVVAAAIGAGCRRLVWASHLGVDDPGDNDYLRACAEIEDLLEDAPLETVVIRRALTYGAGDSLTAMLATSGVPAAVRAARHRPLHADDLAAAVIAADRHREVATDLHLVVSLAGPDEVELGEFIDLLGGPREGGDELPAVVRNVLGRDLVGGPDTLGSDGVPVATGARRVRLAPAPPGAGG